MDGKNELYRIRKKLRYSQRDFATALRQVSGDPVTQQAISQAEVQDEMPEAYKARILTLVDERHPESRQEITAVFEGGLRQRDVEMRVPLKSDWEHSAFEPIERSAFSWALTFRNHVVLERLQSIASRRGFDCESIPEGLKLVRRKAGGPRQQDGNAIFSAPNRFGLKKGKTVVVLGAASRHVVARRVFSEISRRINIGLNIKEFSGDSDGTPHYPFYFGYQTVLKYLTVDGKSHHPSRYADDAAIFYEDFGVILSSPLDRITQKGERPFGRNANRVILVAGLHRLATGVGVRLLEDEEWRKSVFASKTSALAAGGHDFESDQQTGALVYRVVVRHDGQWSTVDAVEIVKAATV